MSPDYFRRGYRLGRRLVRRDGLAVARWSLDYMQRLPLGSWAPWADSDDHKRAFLRGETAGIMAGEKGKRANQP